MAEPDSARRRGWLVPLVIAAVIAAWIGFTLIGGRLLPEGSAAPEFSLPRPDGTMLSLAELRGKVVVLDFWSVTCPPCLEELPTLASLWRRMESRGVVVVGIAAGGESRQDVARFAKERGIDYPLAVDGSGSISAAYRISALPTIYVISREGTVAASHVGAWSGRDLVAAVESALRSGH
ncbi:MAG TPA: TlpA disulfide reductase family protein [Polyangia bacterium]|nr:TlpA disulfide reductase family protein [Polyangia bacterium]